MTEPAEKPRSWLPLIIAGSLAVLVVVGAVVTHLVREDLSPEKQAAVEACEDAYKSQFPDGPGIVGGDIYAVTEWQALADRMVSLGYLSAEQATFTGEEADAKNSEAAKLVAAGGEQMTVIWQRDDESHATCVASLQDGEVTSAKVTELTQPSTSPTPTPSS